MARFSFGLFGQDTNELLAGQKVKIKNVDTGQFVASTSPEGSQLRIYDNNDGTYFVDGHLVYIRFMSTLILMSKRSSKIFHSIMKKSRRI